jgi:hypothetical protein
MQFGGEHGGDRESAGRQYAEAGDEFGHRGRASVQLGQGFFRARVEVVADVALG